MRTTKFQLVSFQSVSTFALALATVAVLLPACSVNVKKEQNGEDKQVDISTPIGGIHVNNDAHVADVGLMVYPGSRLKQKDSSGDDKSANVDISALGYGVKVVAMEYESDDSPAKLVAFYKDQLQKYGHVLECHTSGHLDVDTDFGDDSGKSSRIRGCVGSTGKNTELRVGARENQHIVAVEPDGKGSSFSLVYVRTHGKDAEI